MNLLNNERYYQLRLVEYWQLFVKWLGIYIDLVKRDFYERYLSSYLGVAWAFIQPLVTFFVIWFVFQHGFKVAKISDSIPFSIWLIAGLIPWFYLSESTLTASGSILQNAEIVKKVVFPIHLLPLVKLGTALLVHLVLVSGLCVYISLSSLSEQMNLAMLIYYIFASTSMLFGIGFISSAVTVFFRDTTQILSVIIQIGFWATPIFWNVDIISERYQRLIWLNPATYIVNGFREAILPQGGAASFVPHWVPSSFWVFVGANVFFGIVVFKRLKSHFSEVL